MAGIFGDLLLAIESLLGLPYPFILITLVFGVYIWATINYLKDRKSHEGCRVGEIASELEKQRELLEQIAASTVKKNGRNGKTSLGIQGVLLERESVDGGTHNATPFTGASDPDIPRDYNGGTLVEINYMDGIRTAKYAKRHPNFPDQVLSETYRFPLRGRGPPT